MLSGEVGCETYPVEFAVKTVDFGNLRLQFLAVAFRQAAHHDQLFDPAVLFGRNLRHDFIDRFLLGIADETAGVHHHGLGIGRVCLVGIVRLVFRLEAGICQHGEQSFAVDKVF